eukprot:g4303.t1
MDLRSMMARMGGGGMSPEGLSLNLPDSSETVHISSMALLKMLKHGRAGIPMEVMGLMLGSFVDEYMVRVVDVFAMPQSGTGVSVEAVDPVYQQKFMEMVKQTGRSEVVVGWYHSHPGFGCWMSGVDINTHKSFEQLSARAVAVVVDPVQSVKGKVVIDAFRLINRQFLMLGMEPRQTTSNISFLNKPSIQALIHGLNRHYYSMNIDFRKTDNEMAMLTNLYKRNWTSGLKPTKFADLATSNEKAMERMVRLSEDYNKRIIAEEEKTQQELMVENVGKVDPKRHLESSVSDVMASNIVQCLATMLDTVAF